MSLAGLVGGGSMARPGEISRAGHGVLFLDELAEFEPATVQALRQPLEQGRVFLTRSAGSVAFPARFQLVAATNPCPVAGLGRRPGLQVHPGRPGDLPAGAVRSAPGSRRPAGQRPPNPFLRRWAASRAARARVPCAEQRVLAARSLQLKRQGMLNASIRAAQQLRCWAPPVPRLGAAWSAGSLRRADRQGFHRAWRVARTLADLEAAAEVEERHVMEALGYRLAEHAG